MDEPVTPAGRLFLRPEMNQIINCAIGFENPIDIEAIKTELSTSLLVQHPRFCSLLVKNKKGREFWRKTQINLDDHIIIHNQENDEDKINSLLADFAVSSPLSLDKPLWEVHIVTGVNCVILRIHHALGDGISLMTLFLASCKKLHGNEDYRGDDEKKKSGSKKGIFEILKLIWYTVVFVIGFIGRVLWVSDKKTVISGGDGVELWPRLLAVAKFELEDMKIVKKAIANATINDVLFGVISSGISRYLGVRSPHVLQEELQITGLAMVNLRKQPGLQEMEKLMNNKSGTGWGNRFGMMLLPVYCHTRNEDPLCYVKRAKVMIDQKKQSLESHFSYGIGNLVMSLFGPKVASLLNYRIVCNTTFTISNIVGPSEELTYAGNPITFVRATSSGLAHAITMHMVSYAGKANMQILVAKDIIPDPHFLAKCFEDALLEMKNAAKSGPCG
ncbi:wax ester synthase/diacylglycerol acyltransferase 11-like [Silene latifolia]|uniref:wax ester synthase/diacylglycerol acyltransferase 11-like n=1 Tax=Silene latifolia TaxID=37657 RepID=UPI003D78A847